MRGTLDLDGWCDAIEGARRCIPAAFLDSPLLTETALDDLLGCRVLLKVETLNPVRSFKGRGAYTLVRSRPQAGPLVCASAGNFGLGIAYACADLERRAHVFAPETANSVKIEALRRCGAEVTLVGADLDAAKDAARVAAREHGWTFVEDGREAEMAAGAGTIAAEVTGGGYRPDLALVPVGNGSLAVGMAAWTRRHLPEARIVGVGPAGAPAMARSFQEGRPVSTSSVQTMADGLAVRVPVPEILDPLRSYVDEVRLVTDACMLDGMRRIAETTGLLVEPSAAAALVPALEDLSLVRGHTVLIPLTGGNLAASTWTLNG